MSDTNEPDKAGPAADVEGTPSAEEDGRPQFHVNDKRFWVARQ
jgi:hypothetical protein